LNDLEGHVLLVKQHEDTCLSISNGLAQGWMS